VRQEEVLREKIASDSLARRLARAIASDILLYNEEKIEESIKDDKLFDVVKDAMFEGKEHFAKRVSPAVSCFDDAIEQAIVDIIFYQKGKDIDSSIW